MIKESEWLEAIGMIVLVLGLFAISFLDDMKSMYKKLERNQ